MMSLKGEEMLIQDIIEGKYNLCIVHFVKTKLQKFLT